MKVWVVAGSTYDIHFIVSIHATERGAKRKARNEKASGQHGSDIDFTVEDFPLLGYKPSAVEAGGAK